MSVLRTNNYNNRRTKKMDFSVFEKYGVTPANLLDSSGEAFISLRNAYVDLVTELDESKEEVEKEGDSFLSIQKSEVEKNETLPFTWPMSSSGRFALSTMK
jgi:hypothetical protein